ncbi:MAG: hypothetical protein IH944_02270 [Armatimonadetes bacterium]|nr:hypothetical protein [Armatimonadota bacterium]
MLQAFHGIAVHLKGRGKFAVSSEAEVQDLMYSILKPILPDLYDENPQPKAGIISSRPDFTSRAAKAFFEAKFVNSKSHAKSVQREMQTDIEQYAHSQDCNEIWFYVYDPHNHIADAEAMRKAIERDRTLDGRRVTARLIVQPK